MGIAAAFRRSCSGQAERRASAVSLLVAYSALVVAFYLTGDR